MKAPRNGFGWTEWVICVLDLTAPKGWGDIPIELLIQHRSWWLDYEPCKHEPIGQDGEPLYPLVERLVLAHRLATA